MSESKFDNFIKVAVILNLLLLMALAFQFYYGIALFQRIRAELLHRERNTRWVEELVE